MAAVVPGARGARGGYGERFFLTRGAQVLSVEPLENGEVFTQVSQARFFCLRAGATSGRRRHRETHSALRVQKLDAPSRLRLRSRKNRAAGEPFWWPPL